MNLNLAFESLVIILKCSKKDLWDFTISESVRVLGKRGFCRSALNSPVIIIVLYVAKKGASISKNSVGDAALGRL